LPLEAVMNKDDVIYHIFLDRFAGFSEDTQEHRPDFLGGNLLGVLERLSYLVNLGVTWIWISPFQKGVSYHGYHITDFYEVDERFGTKDDLRALIEACHARGIKVMGDFVPNHCSDQHPFFLDAKKNPESPYRDWFNFSGRGKHEAFLHFGELVKFNMEHPDVRAHVIGSAKYWIREFGLDALRLDHVIGLSNTFWEAFAREVKSEKDIPLIGEVSWVGIRPGHLKTLRIPDKRKHHIRRHVFRNEESAMLNYVGILDGCLDFVFWREMRAFARGRRSKEKTLARLEKHYAKYPENFLLPTFLDNHDLNRFLHEARGERSRLKAAAEIQFSIPQPKIIYYGTEVGMTHEKNIRREKHHGDLHVRKKMRWDEAEQDRELLAFYKDLIKRRVP